MSLIKLMECDIQAGNSVAPFLEATGNCTLAGERVDVAERMFSIWKLICLG